MEIPKNDALEKVAPALIMAMFESFLVSIR